MGFELGLVDQWLVGHVRHRNGAILQLEVIHTAANRNTATILLILLRRLRLLS